MPPEIARPQPVVDASPTLVQERSPMTRALETHVRDPLVAVMQARLAGPSRPTIVSADRGRFNFDFSDVHPDGSVTSLYVHATGIIDAKSEVAHGVVGIDADSVVSISAFVGTTEDPMQRQVVFKGPAGRNPEAVGRVRGETRGPIRSTEGENPEQVLADMLGVTTDFLAKYPAA